MGVTSLHTKFERMRLYRAPFFPIRIFLLFEVKALCFLSSSLPTLRSFCFDTGTHLGRAGRKGGGRSDGCATYMDVRQAMWYIWPLAISRGGEGGKRGLLYESCKKRGGSYTFSHRRKSAGQSVFSPPLPVCANSVLLCPPSHTDLHHHPAAKTTGPFSPPRSLLRLWAPPLRSRGMPQLYGLRPPPLSPFSICLLRLCLPSFPPRETSVSPPPPPGGREKVAHKHQTLSIVEVFGVVERAAENGAEWSLITQHSLLLLLVALLSFWPPCPPRAEALFSDFCSISSN